MWGDDGGGNREYYTRALAGYEVGTAYLCWYDPANPRWPRGLRRLDGLAGRPGGVLPLVFVVFLGGAGLLFLWISVVSALDTRVPQPIRETGTRSLAPGESVDVVVVQPGPTRLHWLKLSHYGEEAKPRTRRSPDVRVLYDEIVAECGPAVAGANSPIELAATLRVPADALPTRLDQPAGRWAPRARCLPRLWPRSVVSFPVTVEASPHE